MSERRMRDINLGLRFVLELAALAGFLVFGLRASDEAIISVFLGLGLPLVAMAAWGTFISPKAPRRIDDPVRLGIEVGIFGLAALALVASGFVVAGVLLAVAAGISLLLMVLWDQRGA